MANYNSTAPISGPTNTLMIHDIETDDNSAEMTQEKIKNWI